MYLCSFGSPVHLHTQIISVSLPMQLAVNNIEEIANADLLAGRHLHQSHSGWDIFVLWYPECDDVVTRRPGEVPVDTTVTHQKLFTEHQQKKRQRLLLDSTNLETLLVQQAHRLEAAEEAFQCHLEGNYRVTESMTTCTSSYRSLIDAQSIWGHPSKELSVVTPSENKRKL